MDASRSNLRSSSVAGVISAMKASGGPGRGGTPLAIFVCDRDNFGSIGKIEPNGINAVAVVPLARSTDDGDPVGFFHR